MQKYFRKKKVYASAWLSTSASAGLSTSASAGLSTSASTDETDKWKTKYFVKQKKDTTLDAVGRGVSL